MNTDLRLLKLLDRPPDVCRVCGRWREQREGMWICPNGPHGERRAKR